MICKQAVCRTGIKGKKGNIIQYFFWKELTKVLVFMGCSTPKGESLAPGRASSPHWPIPGASEYPNSPSLIYTVLWRIVNTSPTE